VARILKGKVAAPNVSLVVAPGSRQVLQAISAEGSLGDLIAAGARLDECACASASATSQSPSSKGVVAAHFEPQLRRPQRHEGRPGVPRLVRDGRCVRLAGRIVDPRTLPMKYPKVEMPKRFAIDDRMFVFPKDGRGAGQGRDFSAAEHRRPPTNDPFPTTVRGVASIKVGDKVTTDHIIPAGALMKYARTSRSTRSSCSRTWTGVRLPRREGARRRPAQHHRGRRELRGRVFPRARGHLPDVPRRQGGAGEVVPADPHRQPRQLRHPAPHLRETRRTTTASPSGTSLEITDVPRALKEGRGSRSGT